MSEINIRDIDETENKMIIDVLLDGVKDYPRICKPDDFVFKAEIDDFLLVSTGDSDINGYYCITAYYKLKSNTKKNDFDATVKLIFCASKEDSHKIIRDSLDESTAPVAYVSKLPVGDFTLGDIFYADFVRENMYVIVQGMDDTEVDSLAQEIDQQILDIISR